MNKTINHIFLSMLLTAIAATVASCTDELDLPADSSPTILLPGEYRFIIGHDDEPPMSRVEYTDEKSSRFETGDRIGVFATNSEKQIQNDVFSARYLDGTSVQVLAPPKGNVTQGLDTEIPTGDTIRYIFYHPMNPEWKLSDITRGTGLSYSVEPDQSTKEAYEHSDFLWNYLNSKPEKPIQVIKMHHLMANIIVRIHRDSIDNSNDADNGVTLKNIHTSADNIQLTKQLNKEMNYHVPANGTVSDIKMYCQGESGEYLIYRAAVPAWQTLAEGSEIISVNLFNRAGDTEKVTYTLAAPLSLKDGYYYTFTLRSAVKPAVPEVSDDDSWVLDVFDPETNEIVGLLCREYIRYQPGMTDLMTPDKRTGSMAKEDKINISSQAWVFYNLKDGSNLPELKYGTVLRFVYDIIGSQGYDLGGSALTNTWPYPHHWGLEKDAAGGFFLTKHGHEWILDTDINAGNSSKYWTEYYMHGGKIEWEKTSSNSVQYYHIKEFTPSDLKISNNTALTYGHIAIPTNSEEKPYVSYDSFDELPEPGKATYDRNGNKIAYVLPHYLVDSRIGGKSISYPLVKIGYNNFWMSKSLRASVMTDGTDIKCLNRTPTEGENQTASQSYVSFDNQSTYIDYPARLYPHSEAYDVYSEAPDPDNFPFLYNHSAIKDPSFVPPSQDDRLTVMFPTENLFDRTLSYFGWSFAAKLMTSNVATMIGDGIYSETEKEALSQNKIYCTTYKCFACNISGFNLRTNGYHIPFNPGFAGFGTSCSLWLGDDLNTTDGTLKYLSFACYNAFENKEFANIMNNISLGSWPGLEGASRYFFAVRFLLKFKGQEDSNSIELTKGISKSRVVEKSTDHKPESTVVSVHVIECKE